MDAPLLDKPVTDEELTKLALAADPDLVVDDDAVCFWDLAGIGPSHALPEWYMPSPVGGTSVLSGWRRQLVRFNLALIVTSFLAINAYGLCNTYGQLNFT